ncbi:phosphotransferase-like protein [Actinoplanes sp. CA-252034]|uniref:phosphotransferase-like protein n=1 Tax=Actinoplanes sp. CA-252034 TaxID=3239906 RepID=UPI003D97DCA2
MTASTPPVVMLNGASCAGKTTLGRALQNLTGEPMMLLGLDTCFTMVPDRWAGGPEGQMRHLGFAYDRLPDDDGHPMLRITHGDIGTRMLTGFHRAVTALLAAGNPVIIDEMLLSDHIRDDWLHVLTPWRPLYVGVYCDDTELARREHARGNRPGLARWSARHAHHGMTYHLSVDTTTTDPATAAARIAAALTG